MYCMLRGVGPTDVPVGPTCKDGGNKGDVQYLEIGIFGRADTYMWSVVLVDDLAVFPVLVVPVIAGEAGERTHQGDAHDD